VVFKQYYSLKNLKTNKKKMKKLISILGILLLMFTPLAFAVETQEVEAGLTPDNSFYFLDKWGEGISLALTFDNEKKAEKHLEYAKERIAELESNSFEKQYSEKQITDLEQRFENHIQKANKNAVSKDLSDKIDALNKTQSKNKVTNSNKNQLKHQYTEEENKFLTEFKNETFQIIINDSEILFYQVQDNGIKQLSVIVFNPDYTIEVEDKEKLLELVDKYNKGDELGIYEILSVADIPVSLKARLVKVGVFK
jgi:hypothetical protein